MKNIVLFRNAQVWEKVEDAHRDLKEKKKRKKEDIGVESTLVEEKQAERTWLPSFTIREMFSIEALENPRGLCPRFKWTAMSRGKGWGLFTRLWSLVNLLFSKHECF